MNLKAKVHVETQKKDAQAQLDARRAWLKEKGFDANAIGKDPVVRRMKAVVRKANFRLARIDAQEKLNQARAQEKVKKQATPKAPKEIQEEAPEGKGTKGKKEKGKGVEKTAKSEGRNEDPKRKTKESETP